jgi:hypothetical protein
MSLYSLFGKVAVHSATEEELTALVVTCTDVLLKMLQAKDRRLSSVLDMCNQNLLQWSDNFANGEKRRRIRRLIDEKGFFVALVARYPSLTDDEKESAVRFTWNYGETDEARRVPLESGLLHAFMADLGTCEYLLYDSLLGSLWGFVEYDQV